MKRADYALLGIGIMATLMVFVPIVASAEIPFAFAQVTNSTFTNSTLSTTNSTLTITNSTSTTSTNSTSTTTTSTNSTTTISPEPIVEEPQLPTEQLSITRYTQPTDSFVNQVKTSYGSNYNLVEDFNIGEATWTSTPERIMDGTWKNYSLKQEDQKIAIYSNAVGSIIYDLPTCSYSIYENGYNGQNIIPSVSAVATANINGVWQNLEVNDELCSVNVVENLNGATITATKTLTDQTFVHEIQFDINKGIKETFKVWNVDDVELGISQTVHTGESITVGENTIDIAQANGQSFDRAFLEANKAQVFEIANGLNYDFDLGFDSLSNINIFYDGDYKVNLDYADGGFVNYLEIDPTFTAYYNGGGLNNRYDVRTGQPPNSTQCNWTGQVKNFGSYHQTYLDPSNSPNYYCSIGGAMFDVSTIPDGSTITDVQWTQAFTTVGNPRNCDIKLVTIDPVSSTASALLTEMRLGTTLVSNNTFCTNTSTHTVDLGTTADSSFTTSIANGQDWVAFSYPFNNLTRDTSYHEINSLNTSYLTLTYTLPPPPDVPTNLSITQSTSGEFNLSWTAPTSGTTPTGYKIERSLDGSNWTTVTADTGNTNTSYTDTYTVPPNTSNLYYRVFSYNSSLLSYSTASAQSSVTLPTAPTNLVATDGLPVGLSYSVPSDDGFGNSNGAELIGYKVYRADNPNAQLPLPDNGGTNGGLDFTDNELLLHGSFGGLPIFEDDYSSSSGWTQTRTR